ncbi:MAG: NADH-quinone oxidoreductase subunit J [bacterium]
MTIDLTPATLNTVASSLLFAAVVAVTLTGAVIAAASRRLVYCVSGLVLSFMGLAGLYVFLNSPFLALMQVLIYIGAICVTIMFALMLADPNEESSLLPRNVLLGLSSFLVAAMLAVGLILVVAKTHWLPKAVQINAGSVEDLGRGLLTRFGFAFELISVVLLLAILGALVVARSGRRTHS